MVSRWVLAGALAVGVGCGNDGGAGQCGAVTPCGGDVGGGWTIQDGCVMEASVAMTALETGCEDTYTGTLDVRMNGTFTFGADQTYVSESTLFGTAHLMWTPSACYMETCAELTQQLNAPPAVPDSPISGGSCTPSGSKCRCTITFRPVATAEQGTYVVSATTLTMTPTTTAASPWSTDFCVAGDKLRMSPRLADNNVLEPTAQFKGSVALVRTQR